MSRGGYRPGAGRPKGSKNLRTRAREKAAKRAGTAGTSPLEFLLGMMRDDGQPLKVRMAAAKAAMPFCHAKLSATQVTVAEAPSHEEMLQALLDEDDGWDDGDFVTPGVTPDGETSKLAPAKSP